MQNKDRNVYFSHNAQDHQKPESAKLGVLSSQPPRYSKTFQCSTVTKNHSHDQNEAQSKHHKCTTGETFTARASERTHTPRQPGRANSGLRTLFLTKGCISPLLLSHFHLVLDINFLTPEGVSGPIPEIVQYRANPWRR